ncbi:endolytic transglycosylase MltG [Streptomyces toxytricini]|uniref:Endolytic murein transglycosylase n=1 Tax=Streptomyces toxytricini TaxID=67369 RepID=A0ABW8EJY6_STRT5
MTEYGRGSGPEPWHPEDPLYGDSGWSGHEAQQGRMPFGGGPQQQYPQEPQHQQYLQQEQYPGQMQGYPQQPHQQMPVQQPAYDGGGQPWATAHGGYTEVPQAAQGYPDTGQYPGAAEGYPGTDAYPAADPYPAPDPYAGADPYAQQPVGGYPGEAPDLYGTPEAYPPPKPPGRRDPEPDAEAEDDEPDEDSALADSGRDGDDDSREAGSGGGRRAGRSKGKGKGKPKRSGAACLVAALVIAGVVGGGGYYGYTYLKARFGSAEDYAGSGNGESVEVEIPNGATVAQMGSILKEAGVVASTQAFIDAATADKRSTGIQPGTYTLQKKMSSASAIAVLVDPSKLNVLTIPEGKRAVEVYKMIDKKLGKPEGTTAQVAQQQAKNLGLPAWAVSTRKVRDPLEGFLYPTRYDLSKETTPESLLKQMVKNANDKYAALGLEGKAKELGLANPYELVIVASLVQVEGNKHDDFRKMSEVIYNRLKPSNTATNQKIEFDSTINYIKGTSNINVSREETRKIDDPYNTYRYAGLPPGPISNPGDEAVNAALDPDKGGWMFFVSIDGNTTTFTKTFAEHDKLVTEFNERQKKKSGG